jgi:hypothetical protein
MSIDRLTILTELCVKNSVQFCGKESNVILLFADKLIEELQAENKKLREGQEWVSVKDRLPPPETPVLAWIRGFDAPLVVQLLWETCNPMVESYFDDFLYWDNVYNDGQDYEDRVLCWQSLPKPPQDKEDKL